PALAIGALIEQSRPTVLIADIEGAEVEVLRAADLTGLRLILVETHPPDIGAAGTRAIFDICHAAGLTYFHRGSHGKVVCFRRDW
ncbi:MAG: FkbM family methyltransferase, partial [Pseudomonadota bacterium]